MHPLLPLSIPASARLPAFWYIAGPHICLLVASMHGTPVPDLAVLLIILHFLVELSYVRMPSDGCKADCGSEGYELPLKRCLGLTALPSCSSSLTLTHSPTLTAGPVSTTSFSRLQSSLTLAHHAHTCSCPCCGRTWSFGASNGLSDSTRRLRSIVFRSGQLSSLKEQGVPRSLSQCVHRQPPLKGDLC